MDERTADGFVGDGVNDDEWWYNCWALSGNDIDVGLCNTCSVKFVFGKVFPVVCVVDDDKALRVLSVDNIVWISFISSAFVMIGSANWRTFKRTLIVSVFDIGLKLISSFDDGGWATNCGTFFLKYWTVVCTNNSFKKK